MKKKKKRKNHTHKFCLTKDSFCLEFLSSFQNLKSYWQPSVWQVKSNLHATSRLIQSQVPQTCSHNNF